MHGRPGYRPILIALQAALACLLIAAPGRAQEDATPLAELTIAVWPEFDQQAALVFYTGQVAADVPTPTEITFTLPDQATINAVAYLPDSGNLTNAEFSIERNDVTMRTPNGTFHIEFYDPALQRNDERRLYTLVWQSAHPVGQLTWSVQQPAGAGSLTMTPGDATLLQDRFGLNVYQVEAGAIPAEQVATLTLSYDKPTSALTVELLGQSGEITPPAAETIPVGLTAALIAAIVVLAGVAVYFYTRFRRVEQAATVGGGPSAPRPQAPPTQAGSASPGLSPEAQAIVAGLTDREIEVMELLAKGMMNKEIGHKLGISPRTVARHRENMMAKLDLHSRTELVKFAIRIGLHDLEEEG